ncbi:MAG: winged helix-turn-helix domain-containing protein [Methanothrix sp.]|nr:winged helix-turn-helix domain-containing protein [Methanothrix sp.]
MMKRSRHVIVSQILDICRGGANKTKIVYQANLNFRTVNPYLELLIENELLAVRRENTLIYETTERGASLLDNFKQINSQLNELNVAEQQ